MFRLQRAHHFILFPPFLHVLCHDCIQLRCEIEWWSE